MENERDATTDGAAAGRITRSAGISEPNQVHTSSDATLLQYVLEERPYVAHRENANDALYKIVYRRLEQGKFWRFKDASDVREKLRWLAAVYKDKNHRSHSDLNDLHGMLKLYVDVQMHDLKSALDRYIDHLRHEEQSEMGEVVTYLDVLLRGVLQFMVSDSVPPKRQSDEKWCTLVDQLNHDLGKHVFWSGSSCKNMYGKVRGVYSKSSKDASIRLTPNRVEVLKQIDDALKQSNVVSRGQRIIEIEVSDDDDDNDDDSHASELPGHHAVRNAKRRRGEGDRATERSPRVSRGEHTKRARLTVSRSRIATSIPHQEQIAEVSDTRSNPGPVTNSLDSETSQIPSVTVRSRHGGVEHSGSSHGIPRAEPELSGASVDQPERVRETDSKALCTKVSELEGIVAMQQVQIDELLRAIERVAMRDGENTWKIQELVERVESHRKSCQLASDRNYVQQEVARKELVTHIANCRQPTAAEFAAVRRSLFGFVDALQGFYERRVDSAQDERGETES